MNNYIHAQPMRSSQLIKLVNATCIPDSKKSIKEVNKIFCAEIYHNLNTGLYMHQNAFLIKYKVSIKKIKGMDIPIRTRIDDYTVVARNNFNKNDDSTKIFPINLRKIGVDDMEENTCYMMILRDESDDIHIVVFKFRLNVIPLTHHDITEKVCDCRNTRLCPTKICNAYSWCIACNGTPDNYRECLQQYAHNKESSQLRFRELIERCCLENYLSVKVYRNVCRLYIPKISDQIQSNVQPNIQSNERSNINDVTYDLSFILAHNFERESQKECSSCIFNK